MQNEKVIWNLYIGQSQKGPSRGESCTFYQQGHVSKNCTKIVGLNDRRKFIKDNSHCVFHVLEKTITVPRVKKCADIVVVNITFPCVITQISIRVIKIIPVIGKQVALIQVPMHFRADHRGVSSSIPTRKMQGQTKTLSAIAKSSTIIHTIDILSPSIELDHTLSWS